MITMSEQALQALRMAVADHNTVRIPIITDRKVWVEIDRALSRIAGGSRWDRRAQAHVYNQDPRAALEQLTGNAVIPPPCVTRDKELSYWATPTPLAQLLIDDLDLPEGGRVLEPSAGDGQLVRALQDAYPLVHIDAVEPDNGRRIVLRTSGGAGLHVWDSTFEDYVEAWRVVKDPVLFDAVVMNPPFTLPSRRYAWAEHLALAWDLLRPGGQLRAIVPASLGFGRQRPIAAARALIGAAGGSFRPAPDAAFRGSGTDISTMIVEAVKEARR